MVDGKNFSKFFCSKYELFEKVYKIGQKKSARNAKSGGIRKRGEVLPSFYFNTILAEIG